MEKCKAVVKEAWRCLFLNPGGHLSLPFLPGFVDTGCDGGGFPLCCPAGSVLFLLPAVEHATILNVSNFESHGPMDHTNALECTLEGALAFDLWLCLAMLQCSTPVSYTHLTLPTKLEV